MESFLFLSCGYGIHHSYGVWMGKVLFPEGSGESVPFPYGVGESVSLLLMVGA